ncbi:hypothetical protein MNB_SV-12-839 [hydrothermal vent metagenome]|uniref:Uncharacterized protein n=1 Tax=hydrothermal vent metagenome TaxID=652676 RepID=A0A1W1CJD2_9ZZZZ
MTNNHNILKLLKEILIKNQNLKENYLNIDELLSFFKYLIKTRENFNSAYLLNYLYQNISAKNVAKRKTTARDFEDYLGILFSGKITDETKRQNSDNQIEKIENDFITNFIISNKREKADILFEDDFALSVKTLMLNNREINLGSFEKTALFYELDIYDYLGERKGKEGVLNGEKVKIGLGSKVLLKNLLLLLKEKGKYDTFKTRFLKMAKEIFADDMLIAIKNDLEMDLYFIKSNDFYNLFKNSIDNIDDFMMIVNRWEGNSIRVDRAEFLKIATHIKLDFNFLKGSILRYFTEFEDKTTNILVKYINDIDNKELYQKEMCNEIEQIINLIEQKIKGIS